MNQKCVLQSANQEVITRFQLLAQELKVEFKVESEQSNVISFSQAQAQQVAAQKPVTIAESEKNAILLTLEKHNGNMSKTAKALDIGRATLYRKIKSYNIEVKVKSA